MFARKMYFLYVSGNLYGPKSLMPAITILTLLLYYLYMYKCTRTMNPIHSCVTDSAVWLIMAVTGKMNNGNVHCLQVQSFKLTVLFRYETS